MKSQQFPPGSFGIPVLGETPSFIFDRNFAKKRYRQYGPIFKTHLLGRPTVVMVGPEALELVLSSQMENFSWREGWPDNFKTLLGESLFLQDGEEHRRNRRLMMPALHGPALANYVSTMEDITRSYLQKWEKQQEFTWFQEFKQLTFDIASQLLLGTRPGPECVRFSKLFAAMTNGLFAINPLPLPFTTFGKAIAARNQILEHLTEVVRERQQNPTKDALSLLVQAQDEEGNRMSEKELIAQALLLLFAGHETTTSMLTWLGVELARHPEVLEKARVEQLQLASKGNLDLEQLGKMPYLEQVLWEVERLHQPVGGGFRGVIKDFEFKGYHVPAGWQLYYSIGVTHRIEEIYSEPDRFEPDRFSPQRQENKKYPFSLVGFGGGPRICIGLAFAKMEMKIVAAHLLRNYHWEILPNQSLEEVVVPTNRPKDGLRVRFQPR
ncbi:MULTISPECIES: cytochrome P450 [unclassified Nostoc]|uniref:cytochrome P450 n=1 Tax=unclassified Nostoc TaxID=2593658 RepID=UPI002AD1EF80|nr:MULTISPECIES: cytochrome P450 [unclassified Nostoc]MDZ8034985.1 cytochrome P450 [Nostoc sp. DedSLP04]MDZ8096686.1 cytochrome P450 [Nostoc sp. DedQUE05]MDZ8130351.1 cytochrome P450 [Nostoc sp. DedQUE07]